MPLESPVLFLMIGAIEDLMNESGKNMSKNVLDEVDKIVKIDSSAYI